MSTDSYYFISWLRRGLTAHITQIDNLGATKGLETARATVEIPLQIKGNQPGPAQGLTKGIQLVGPGDILGLDRRAIIRTDPQDGETDFEPNYLPLVEFYDEDFPWRYTPAAATNLPKSDTSDQNESSLSKLRPWLSLVVLCEDEFTRAQTSKGALPVINVTKSDALPKATEVWAWAHVQVSIPLDSLKPHTSNPVNDKVHIALRAGLQKNPDRGISRLLCPRRLKPQTRYYAFLLPTFEAGRRAGLGESTANVPTQAPAWGSNQPVGSPRPSDFPVYYEWSFLTGVRGDFEYLVRLLQPRELAGVVGSRALDVTKPGLGVTGITNPPELGLEGAVKSPNTQATPWPTANPEPFQKELTDLINKAEQLHRSDAVITPPLYGRWHALATQLDLPTNPPWLQTLNLDPRWRAIAGLGALMVQQLQEELMNDAWNQLGQIEAANRLLRWAQLTREVNRIFFEKHLRPLEPIHLLSITAPVHERVLCTGSDSKATLDQRVKASALPSAVFSHALRRITRAGGPVARRLDPTGAWQSRPFIEKINQGELTAAGPKQVPTGIITLNKIADLIEQLPQLAAGESRDDAEQPLKPLREEDLKPELLGTRTDAFAQAARKLLASMQPSPPPPPAPPLNLEQAKICLTVGLDPTQTIPRRVLARLQSDMALAERPDPLAPIMAAPDFARPMYQPLCDYSLDLLIPNLQQIPQNTVALLVSNSQFIEAYMAGLNHEMARELLWRGYPTDQRGTYFRQFWDVSDSVNLENSEESEKARALRLRDIPPLHEWRQELGKHSRPEILPWGQAAKLDSLSGHPDDSRLVLVIRGDLLKRYPNTVIYAEKAEKTEEKPHQKTPVFQAKIDPDITLVGFDLTVKEARGTVGNKHTGWFIVFQERPGEPRFGLDEADKSAKTTNDLDKLTWDALNWQHVPTNGYCIKLTEPLLQFPMSIDIISLDPNHPDPNGKITWGANAADLAYILYQPPFQMAIHASAMLP